ncbi:putative retinol dehydrogenase 13 protein [Coleophoma cylindrospora]|uniref:Putative retinol dehydrogenase 13 protein n=1 Tax=Coleophoma cylindrospora TaxID=1849047 RepID=A0A3D8QNX0_9HELO|nr:putative retinol dehydrogenase 13 protein [Coleophoma cylindrospora]
MNTDPRSVDDLAVTYESQIKGKVVLITGVSPGGIGAAFAIGIASSKPALLILAGRNLTKVQQTALAITTKYSDVKVRNLELDLSSLAAVRTAAETLNQWADVSHIDVVVNNAGVMATDWALSPDGFESQLATNHLGHFLFTNLIMGKILKAAAPRVINISSDGHRLSPFRFEDYNFRDGKIYNKWLGYGQSKTANMLMTISLAEKLGAKHKLSAFSINPGVITTNLDGHLKLYGESEADLEALLEIDCIMGNAFGWLGLDISMVKPPEVGANTYVYAAFDPEVTAHNGAYLQNCRVSDPWTDTVRPWATSSFEAERLWLLSEKLVGQKFSY